MLEDPFGGHVDALKGRVRSSANRQPASGKTCSILRFFRFSAYFGTDGINPAGLKACADHAGQIKTLSGERIRAEFLKLLAAPDPVAVLASMDSAGILQNFLPGPCDLRALTRLIAIESETPDPMLRHRRLHQNGPNRRSGISADAVFERGRGPFTSPSRRSLPKCRMLQRPVGRSSSMAIPCSKTSSGLAASGRVDRTRLWTSSLV